MLNANANIVVFFYCSLMLITRHVCVVPCVRNGLDEWWDHDMILIWKMRSHYAFTNKYNELDCEGTLSIIQFNYLAKEGHLI